jgi:hypothetical protein
MKKLFSLSMVAIFAIALMFSGCGKYDDGPKFSLASKKGRVVNVWKIEKYIVNGTEIPADPSWENSSTEFTKDGKVIDTWSSGGVTLTSSTDTWAFGSKKETLEITSTSGSVSVTTAYKILRLKGNELWTEETDGSNKYEVHMVTK